MRDYLDEWKKYEAGKRFNNRMEPPYYDMVTTHWDFFYGNQWGGSGAFDDLPKPVMNICNRTVMFDVASLTTNPIKINYEPLAKNPFSDDQEVDIDILNSEVANFIEKQKVQAKVKEMYTNGAIAGDMCLHLIMDKDRKPYDGKFSSVKGEVTCEVIDGNNIYFGNPNNKDVQSQPHIIIAGRATVKELQDEYNQFAKDEYKIQSDTDYEEQAGDSGKLEIEDIDDLGKATYIIYYEKKKKKIKTKDADGNVTTNEIESVYVSKLIADRYIYKEVDTGLQLYPIAFENWETQKNNYHGRSKLSSILPNQIFINRAFSMAMQNLIYTAFPKVIYDANRLKGGWNNRIGSAIGVDNLAPGDNIGNLVKYLEPGKMSSDVINMIDLAMNYTKDMLGASDALMGNVNPEYASGSAITVTARQAGIPLESPKANMYNLLEDVGLIFLDMVTQFYGERPVIYNNEGEKTILLYDFSKLNDIYLSTKVEVGATTIYDELSKIKTLDNLRNIGILDDIQYLERLPEDWIERKSELIADKQEQINPQEQPTDFNNILSEMPDNIRQEFMALPPEQQQQYMQQLTMPSGDVI